MKIIIAFAVWILSVSPAFSQDYRSEIIKHVIEPCHAANIKRGGLTKYMSHEEAMMMMKITMMKTTEKTIAVMLPIVRTMESKQRMMLYRIGAKICIRAGEKEK